MIQARQDGAVGAALLLALPPAFYAAVHWAALGAWTHAWSLAILAAAPWCLLLATDGARSCIHWLMRSCAISMHALEQCRAGCVILLCDRSFEGCSFLSSACSPRVGTCVAKVMLHAIPKHMPVQSQEWCIQSGIMTAAEGVWWLSARKGRRDGVRAVLLVPAVGALLAGLEGRVVFRAFGQYLRLSPPWSYLAVTVALYGAALLVVLHCAGSLLPKPPAISRVDPAASLQRQHG